MNEPKTEAQVTPKLLGDAIVTPNQVWAEGGVVLERPQPVRVILFTFGRAHFRELAVPMGVRYLHRQLLGELPLAIRGKPFVRCQPCFRRAGSGDDADSHTRVLTRLSRLVARAAWDT